MAWKDGFFIRKQAPTQLKYEIKMFILNYGHQATLLYITKGDFFSLTTT